MFTNPIRGLFHFLVFLSLLTGALPFSTLRTTESAPLESECECCIEIFVGLHLGRHRLERRQQSAIRKLLPNDATAVNERISAMCRSDVVFSGHRLANGLLAPLLT